MNDYPIVFVHGLMGWGENEGLGLRYFGFAQAGVGLGRLANRDFAFRRRALFPSVGPISSHHDRACELFYRIKGGRIRYGAEHASAHGHKEALSTRLDGLYGDWEEERPVHLVGHSQGAPTIRKLQHLLAQGDFFRDERGRPYPTSAGWVRSITSISGVLNGSLATYVLGCSMQDGRVLPYSLADRALRLLGPIGMEPSELWSAFRKYVYDFDMEPWRRKSGKLDFDRFVGGEDNAAYDLSVHASQAFNDEVGEHPETFYLSYVTSQSQPTKNGHHRPALRMAPFMQPISEEIGRFPGGLSNLRAPIHDYSLWWENDGLVSTYAQDVPRGSTTHAHKRIAAEAKPRPGIWNVMGKPLPMDHVDIVTLPELIPGTQIYAQLRFYKELYDVLSDLP